MSITIGKVGKGNVGDTNTITANWTGGGNSAAGSTLLACLQTGQTTTLTPTTPSGATLRASSIGSGGSIWVYEFVNASAVSGITIGYSTGAATPVTLQIVELAGAGANDSTTTAATGSGLTETTNGITTVAANAVMVAFFSAPNSVDPASRSLTTPGAGFTQFQTQTVGDDGTLSTSAYGTYNIVSTTQSGTSTTCAVSGTGTPAWRCIMLAYAQAAPAGTYLKRRRILNQGLRLAKSATADSATGTESDLVIPGFGVGDICIDTGTGTEAYTLALSDSDSGTATENGAAGALVQLDAGIGTESATLTILGTEAPTGTESDLIDPGSTTSVNVTFDYDIGTGNEVSYTLSQTVFDSGLATESATLTVQITATEAGAFNDLSAETIIGTSGGNEFNTVTDSGLGTETIARVTILGPTDTDSGTGTEGAFVLQVQASETGTGTEAAKVLPQATADSGTGSESYVITSSGPTPGTDSGTGTEAALLGQSSSDVGAFSDGTVSITATLTDTDAGSGVDTGLKNDPDSATGTESVTLTPTAADSGTGSEATTILGLLSTVTDSGKGAESVTLTILGVDSAAGTDGATLRPIGTESGSGTEVIASGPLSSDSGAGSESVTNAVTTGTGTDSCTGSELAVLLTILGSDAGSGSESAAQSFSSSDSGTGHESITQLSLIQVTDSGIGLELSTFTAGRLGTGSAVWSIPGSEGINVAITGSEVGGVEQHDPGSD